MIFLPISLNITDKNILVIGGGRVAFQKIRLLLPFTNNITVVAKEISDDVKSLPVKKLIEKEYEPLDLEGYFVIYAATNLFELNKRVYDDAHKHGTLVCVVDNVPYCDFVSPAIYKRENMTVAVGSNAEDVKASIRLRDKIKIYLENDNTHLHQL
jgi:precorrin-2 dehydrogenase / sirohydrochlorin ferrochelatase